MCKLLLSLIVAIGALPGPEQFAGLDVQKVGKHQKRGNKFRQVVVTVPSAQMVIRDTSITAISTISALDNSRLVRVVGKLTFGESIGPLSVESATRRQVVIVGSGVRLRVTGDALCQIEPLVEDISVTYQSMINAEWRKGSSADWMFADRRGGSLFLVSGTGSYDDASRIVTTTLKVGKRIGVASLPSAPWDPARLYVKGSKPHVTFIFTLEDVNRYLDDTDRWFGVLAERDFGTLVLFHDLYTNGTTPVEEAGEWVHKWTDSNSIQKLVRESHRRGFRIATYLQAGEFQSRTTPKRALEFMRNFVQEWDLDGWYFDNAMIARSWWDNYEFMRAVRDQVGAQGFIYHHTSVDVWGGWSGRTFSPLNSWCDGRLVGETGPLAKIDSVGNPYLFFVTRGFSGVPIGCHKLSAQSTLDRNVMHMLLSFPEMRSAMRIGFPAWGNLAEFDDHYWTGYVKTRDMWRRAKGLGWLCSYNAP